ncbi:hypothetical protein HOP50_17g79350 [Chloropicon primus]|uniref:Uncharacterized protein n=2 Tax=Chloropicon primus TaxID=1764295 RepID=A0A5B8N0G8_9CHLO|nr:hypothetical protein A3770_17p79130 [Chloropicon primus]UPR04593.1 hypothetical protein HOP50_17g79350 [Chloropicon primus]|eukprot:QDZ25395.1 hypothetical protein A3770_17p79130 [Chloropicon primus]
MSSRQHGEFLDFEGKGGEEGSGRGLEGQESPTEEMFLDLFDAFLGYQATALPQSAGAAELGVTHVGGGAGIGYSFQSGQYVDSRTVQMSRRITAVATHTVSDKVYSSGGGESEDAQQASEEKCEVIVVAASDLLNNHLAFCTHASGDLGGRKWHVIPWKRGSAHSIVSLGFNSDGTRLLVANARGMHVLDTDQITRNVVRAWRRRKAAAAERKSPNKAAGVGMSNGGKDIAPDTPQATGPTWSWAQKSAGAGDNDEFPSSPGAAGRAEQKQSTGNDRRRSKCAGSEEAVCLMRNSQSKIVACLCWKRSGDGAEVACAVARNGQVTMYDLESNAQLCQQELEEPTKFDLTAPATASSTSSVRKVFHIRAHGYQSLLLCTSPQGGGPFYSLLLECADPVGSVGGYEALPEAAILKEFQVKELGENVFGVTPGRSGIQLSVHKMKQTAIVACHDTVLNTLELYDVDTPEMAVFLHNLPPATLQLIVSDVLIFAIHGPHRALEEGKSNGGAVSASGAAGALFNSFDWIGIEDSSMSTSHYFVSIISRFIADPEKGRGQKPMNLVLQQLPFPSERGKANKPLGAQVMAAECSAAILLWTDTSAFVCSLRQNPESLFFKLLDTPDNGAEVPKKAELVALSLRLDILRLYKQAASNALKRKKFSQANLYFVLAGLSELDIACELLAAQCPGRALSMLKKFNTSSDEKARVLKHAAIAMNLMQKMAQTGENVASDAASAAAAAIADWALVCCRGGDKRKRAKGEKSFRLMVSAAILAGIMGANKSEVGATLDEDSMSCLLEIHDNDFASMLKSMMETGAVSNLPFVTEEDLVSLLTRDVTVEAKLTNTSSFSLGSCERTVSALFAMQARLDSGNQNDGERSRLQDNLQRILASSNGGTLDRAWALPVCIAWNNTGAASGLLRSSGCLESAIVCRLLEISESMSGKEASKAAEEEHCEAVLELVRLCKEITLPSKCIKCLYFLLVYWHGANLPVDVLEKGILTNGLLKKDFCNHFLSAEKLLAQHISEKSPSGPPVFFSGKFLWDVAQKSCTEDLQRKVAHKSWSKIKKSLVGGSSSTNASRKIVVSGADLRRAGRGQLVVFSCGHHFTEREFREKIIPSLSAALEHLPRLLPLTSKLLLKAYQGPTFHLSCPVCSYNTIAAKFAKPALAPSKWL